METALAIKHQIHGVQPVLPVPDVAAAAQWFCSLLGFQIDFEIKEPDFQYARVRLGDHSFGDPVYIHLRQAGAADLQPCGETRLHVGHDVDGLYVHVQALGGDLLSTPADQAWGLREFALRAPGGHRLILGAEVASSVPAENETARTVVVVYRPKPGQHAALLDEVRRHVPTLQTLGLATHRAPFVMRAADGSLVEVFEWSSAQAISRAHQDPEVQALWARLAVLCSVERLNSLPETAQMFAEFETV